jgi:hypothetical protein
MTAMSTVLNEQPREQPRRFRRQTPTTRWARVRTQGRGHFLWYYGILGVGLPTAMFKIVVDLSEKQPFPLFDVFLNAVLLLICGLLVGFLTWSISERRFKRRYAIPDTRQIARVV